MSVNNEHNAMAIGKKEYLELRSEALESMPICGWMFRSVCEQFSQNTKDGKCGVYTSSRRLVMSEVGPLISAGARRAGKTNMVRHQFKSLFNLDAHVSSEYLSNIAHQTFGATTLFYDHFSIFVKLKGEFE